MRPDERRVRIETVFGDVEGFLRCNATIRTLDEMNLASHSYVVVHEPTGEGVPGGPDAGGPLAIQKDAVLFVLETQAPTALAPRPVQARGLWRASLEVRVGHYTLHGLVHIPPGGDPFARLERRGAPFIAMTSVVATSDGKRWEAPFLAINTARVLAAREMDEPIGGRAEAVGASTA